jgi:hypothetical protein
MRIHAALYVGIKALDGANANSSCDASVHFEELFSSDCDYHLHEDDQILFVGHHRFARRTKPSRCHG